MMKKKYVLTAIIIVLIFTTGLLMSHIKDRAVIEINSAKELMALLEQNPQALNNVALDNKNLQGLIVKDMTIKNLDLERIDLRNAHFERVRFIGGDVTATDFRDSYFEDVQFIGMTFNGIGTERIYENLTRFSKSHFKDVTFENSELYSVLLHDLKKESSLTFYKTKLRETITVYSILAGSELKTLLIEKSDIDEVDMSFIKGNGDLVIANSTFNNSVMSWGLFKTITITDSVLNSSSLHAKNVDTVTIKRNKLLFTLSVEANSVIYSDNIFISEGEYGFSRLSSDNIKKLVISNCNKLTKLGFVENNVDKLILDQCPLGKLHMIESKINNMNYSDSTISNFYVKRSSINHMTLNNIEFKGNITAEGTNISRITKNNVTIADDIKVDEDGKNILKQLQSAY